MVYTATLFPAAGFAVTLCLNTVALLYKSLAAIGVSSLLSVVLMWLLIACPLCVVGTILGRNWSGTSSSPCRRIGTLDIYEQS